MKMKSAVTESASMKEERRAVEQAHKDCPNSRLAVVWDGTNMSVICTQCRATWTVQVPWMMNMPTAVPEDWEDSPQALAAKKTPAP